MKADALLSLGLVQQDDHAVIVMDAQALVTEWYPSTARMFGYERDEMMGRTLEPIFTPEDLARGDLAWELKAARSYGKSDDDRWQVRKDGVRIWVSGVTNAVRDAQGAIVGFVKILRDRTDIKAHMEALQSRLSQAAHTQDARHVMLGTLAHELRNPLGPLRSAAHLIRAATSDRPQVESHLQIIERQIRFIDELLEDLLESTRVGVGKARLHLTTFPLSSAIDAAIETCSAMLRERQQRVEMLISGDLSLQADRVRLQQVLVNLLSNSSKYSPPGTRIWVKATVDGHDLVMRVEDHGRGIPAHLLPKIFDLFTQAEADGGAATEGLGLGLGVVKSIVELHGGTVHARSDGPGKGTEISVRLPLQQPHGA